MGRLGPPLGRGPADRSGTGTDGGATGAAGDAAGVLGTGPTQLARRGRDRLARGARSADADPGVAGSDRPRGARTRERRGRRRRRAHRPAARPVRAGAGAVAAADAAAGRRTSVSSTLGRGGGCSLPLEVKTRRGAAGAAAGATAATGSGSALGLGGRYGRGRFDHLGGGAVGTAGRGRGDRTPRWPPPRPARGRAVPRRPGPRPSWPPWPSWPLGLAAFFSGSGGCSSRTRPSRSALRRTRSAWASTTLDECDLTPIPSDSQRSSVSLLVSPSSRASSYTRMFPAKSGSQFLLAIRPRHRGHPAGGFDCLGWVSAEGRLAPDPGPSILARRRRRHEVRWLVTSRQARSRGAHRRPPPPP